MAVSWLQQLLVSLLLISTCVKRCQSLRVGPPTTRMVESVPSEATLEHPQDASARQRQDSQAILLKIRGGGIFGIIEALLKTAIRNPVLILRK